MNQNSIRWRLPISYALIAFLAALTLGSVMLLVLREYYANQEREYLLNNATALKPILEQALQSDLSKSNLERQINGLAFLSRAQIRLLDENGNEIVNSGEPELNQTLTVSGVPTFAEIMFTIPAVPPAGSAPALIYRGDENLPPQRVTIEHSILPTEGEVDVLLSVSPSPYGYGFSAQHNPDSLRRSSQIVAIPLTALDGNLLGTLEFSNGPNYGADVVESVALAWLIASLFAITIAALAGWFVSKQVTTPVLILESATRKMKQGDLATRIQLPNEKQSEFLSLANSFNGMAEQVERTVFTLRAFIADAAHELHTPLTALQTNLELAANESNASSLRLYLSRASEQTQRLESLVKNLLDLSRLESSESQSKFEHVNLSQLIHEIAEQFASRAEQSNRIFLLNLPDENIQLIGDEMQLRQALINLLENSIKFTRNNDTISLSAQAFDNKIQIKIADTGIGILPEDLPNLFKRFHRGRNVANYAGNGLGLAIVKAIVDAHRGEVSVNSKGSNAGSDFTVTLPAL